MFNWSPSCQLQGLEGYVLSYKKIQQKVAYFSEKISKTSTAKVFGLVGNNSLDWILADLATAQAGVSAVPIPGFFTQDQVAHLCLAAGINAVLFKQKHFPVSSFYSELTAFEKSTSIHSEVPNNTQKITFTSGSTGLPKAVCLSWAQQMSTAQALADVLANIPIKVHLNVLPLPVLLENIAGVYAPLLMGSKVVCLPLAQVGFTGSNQFDVQRCIATIIQYQVNSIIFLPQMLQNLLCYVEKNPFILNALRCLKFIAVGGAMVSKALLKKAEKLGLPVYQGYGLSECASVVSLNTPNYNLLGSVGRVLPGLNIRINESGEILVSGRGHQGIVKKPSISQCAADAWLHTGDLGHFGEGEQSPFLFITGRKKNVLITSFGRNISPEWPEQLLMESGLFVQVVVLGDAQPHLRAILVPHDSKVPHEALQAVFQKVNQELPDYAKIVFWKIFLEGFTFENALATNNGRPLRNNIEKVFAFSTSSWKRSEHVF
jgi:long-chain acyl-CoA synthetase